LCVCLCSWSVYIAFVVNSHPCSCILYKEIRRIQSNTPALLKAISMSRRHSDQSSEAVSFRTVKDLMSAMFGTEVVVAIGDGVSVEGGVAAECAAAAAAMSVSLAERCGPVP
jgi:hypothetical protein